MDCPPSATPPLRSRPYNGGPQISQVTLTVPTTQVVPVGDLYSGKLAFPARFLMLSSVNQAAIGIECYVHFARIGNIYAAAPLVPTGNEAWFPFQIVPPRNYQNQAQGTWLKFAPGAEITEFYIDAGASNGINPLIYTFLYSPDIDFFNVV